MFGSHLSVSGGLFKALVSAEKLGLDTVQIFTASPRSPGAVQVKPGDPLWNKKSFAKDLQWHVKPLADAVVADWAQHLGRLKYQHVVSHDSYLINLGSPDDATWEKSIALFVEELRRADQLGIPYLVTHPGAHMGTGEEAGLKRVAKAMDIVHSQIKTDVLTCIESTAGQGSSLGWKLEHLAEIINLVKAPERVAVCLDTAHLFAAGYDFRGSKYTGFRKSLDSIVGIDRIKAIHINDSKKDLGTRVDRHEHIGHGKIGLEGFEPWMKDKAFKKVPKILETPKLKHPDGREWDEVNLETLRKLMG